MKFFRFFYLGLAVLWLGLVVPGQAVWEVVPLSPQSRLAAPADAAWDFTQVFSQGTLFPGELTCPAGARVTLYFFNQEAYPVRFRVPSRKLQVRIPAGALREISLGAVKPGDLVFLLETLETNLDQNDRETLLLHGRIRAGVWPGSGAVYQAAAAVWRGRLYPSRLVLPSGRHCETFWACDDTPIRLAQVDGRALVWKPWDVTLTEFIRPRQGRFRLEDPGLAPEAELLIR
jgi:hypothetical protein